MRVCIIIRNTVFEYNGKNTNVVIPDSVTYIGDLSFYNCSFVLESVTIPDNVTEIGANAFSGCGSLNIHASAGSFAEAYAKIGQIRFTVE